MTVLHGGVDDKVSVPLSGLTSVNGLPHINGWSGGQKVSVPLSGLTSVNPYLLQALINKGLQGALACLKFNKRF